MDTVEAAQAPETFDVLAFVEQTAYPTQRVVVFQDAKSADEYVKLVAERIELDKAGEDTAELDAKVTELGEKISASSIVFDLRGMPPGIVQEILKVPEGEDESLHELDRDNNLIAKTIIKVSNAKGAVDPSPVSAETVAKLRSFLKEGEFGKLVKAASEVNFNAMVFDQATDAGFSGRRTDVAE
jgi:hypothetical protein